MTYYDKKNKTFKICGIHEIDKNCVEITEQQHIDLLEALNRGATINSDLSTTEKVPTKAELAEQARIAFKANRKILLDNLEITHDGVIYQADEVSQDRMARAIVAMETFPAETTINWVAKDNSIHSLTRADLQAMLGLAGIAQADIWVMNQIYKEEK